jgi:hypothetical protein
MAQRPKALSFVEIARRSSGALSMSDDYLSKLRSGPPVPENDSAVRDTTCLIKLDLCSNVAKFEHAKFEHPPF